MAGRDSYPPSPVPSDRRLWPGELPFTAFGQYGNDAIDVRVFEQDRWWVDRHGRPTLVQDMPQAYVENVIAHLVAYRQQFFVASILRALVQVTGDIEQFGDTAVEPFVSRAVVGPSGWVTAEEWLEATPLMVELRRRSPG